MGRGHLEDLSHLLGSLRVVTISLLGKEGVLDRFESINSVVVSAAGEKVHRSCQFFRPHLRDVVQPKELLETLGISQFADPFGLVCITSKH